MLKLNSRLSIPRSEFKISYSRSSGPGGQNVNKVNTKATLRWNLDEPTAIPWGIRRRFIENFSTKITKDGHVIISSGRHREQKDNLEECFRRLKKMLDAVILPPKKRRPTKPGKGAIERRLEQKRQTGGKKRQRRLVDEE